MKSLLRVVACLSLCASLNSFGALLATSSINFALPQEIGSYGSGQGGWGWNYNPLIINEDESVEYYEIEVMSINGEHANRVNEINLHQGVCLPRVCGFPYWNPTYNRSFDLSNYSNAVATHNVGVKTIYTGGGPPGAMDFIQNLRPESPYFIGNNSNNTRGIRVGYSGVVQDEYIDVSLEIRAFGQPSAVPLPAGIYLFLSGLVGLGLMRGRRSQ